jgi:hypothetical protein
MFLKLRIERTRTFQPTTTDPQLQQWTTFGEYPAQRRVIRTICGSGIYGISGISTNGAIHMTAMSKSAPENIQRQNGKGGARIVTLAEKRRLRASFRCRI